MGRVDGAVLFMTVTTLRVGDGRGREPCDMNLSRASIRHLRCRTALRVCPRHKIPLQ